MKKNRLLSALLLSVLLASLLALPASAVGDGSAPAASGSAILSSMSIQAKAAILVDDDYQEILYEQNAHEKNYPASITKVMTTMLVIESVDRGEHSLDEVVTGDLDQRR